MTRTDRRELAVRISEALFPRIVEEEGGKPSSSAITPSERGSIIDTIDRVLAQNLPE